MKNFRILILLSLFIIAPFALNASNLLYGPWVHNISEHGFTVLWVTEKPSLDYVEIVPDDGSNFETKVRRRYYETKHGRRVIGRYHCVRIDSLSPGTRYYYRIVGKTITDDSNPYRPVFGCIRRITSGKRTPSVRTLNVSADTCRFSMLNDIHSNDARYTSLAAGIDTEKTDFILLNGDIVSYVQNIDTLVKHTIAPIAVQAEQLPIIYARGNHECRGRDFNKVYELFPTSTGQFWYTFRQGPAAFVVLDAGEDKPDNNHEYAGTADYDSYRRKQSEWLANAVKEPSFASAPIKICVIHVPTIKYKNSWYSQYWITEHWAPILEKAGIDLMLSGHHHKWICSEAGQDGKNYPVLVNRHNERMDVLITADGIDVKTYGVDGKIYNQWKLEK